ncbi:glutathione S-transferase family protein [Nannocystis bainbridge]|uniref:Glutathione S-transferase N-terminal domain-containing protein n=1 Tax=Nannocystis bainbridge TaxID=2995303 RepID=A0ABT5E6X3_9BACT|nr:glutathione S-transferase N-terminal domain-containing protein [Nannocystis bainbridge]MDC0721616.1 glutathione S-transferase N-terminal domain-containing protein [Nannocystis bainbridge]
MVATLLHLPISPWSERARWVLDHHGFAHTRVEHVPVIGERKLRRLVGRRDGPATVPVLIDGDLVIADSWEIARHVERLGSGAPLLPEGRLDEVRRWTAVADAAMQSGRAMAIAAMLRDPAALDASMPPPMPGWVRRLLRPVNRQAMQWFARKYGLSLADLAPHAAQQREGLEAVRAGLAASSPYLLGSFSYADIAAATLLQGVQPVADDLVPFDPATRAAWTQPALVREYADLLSWRDELYKKHRRRST